MKARVKFENTALLRRKFEDILIQYKSKHRSMLNQSSFSLINAFGPFFLKLDDLNCSRSNLFRSKENLNLLRLLEETYTVLLYSMLAGILSLRHSLGGPFLANPLSEFVSKELEDKSQCNKILARCGAEDIQQLKKVVSDNARLTMCITSDLSEHINSLNIEDTAYKEKVFSRKDYHGLIILLKVQAQGTDEAASFLALELLGVLDYLVTDTATWLGPAPGVATLFERWLGESALDSLIPEVLSEQESDSLSISRSSVEENISLFIKRTYRGNHTSDSLSCQQEIFRFIDILIGLCPESSNQSEFGALSSALHKKKASHGMDHLEIDLSQCKQFQNTNV